MATVVFPCYFVPRKDSYLSTETCFSLCLKLRVRDLTDLRFYQTTMQV